MAEPGVIGISDSATRWAITVGFSSVGGWSPDGILVRVVDPLNDIATEVGEWTTDRYEEDAEIRDGQIRLWFGRVPRGSPEGACCDVVPELAPIPLAAITSA